MKKLTLNNFIDQKKPLSHIMYAVISVLSVAFTLLRNKHLLPFSEIFLIFLVGFLQLEVFIFAARMIFAGKEYQPSTSSKDFMRTILVRFLVFITLCFVAALVLILLCWIALGYLRGQGPDVAVTSFFEYEFSGWFRATLGGLSIGALIFIVIQWQDALKREQKLREENLVFQNETLRSQVNPHFLFNSLNTVSSLIQTDPARADQFVVNLASVYRYILENGKKEMVPIQAELELTNRYFDLHRVRDEEKITLNVDYTGADSFQILPVSLLILLENAIKHNSATREKPLNISVFFEGQNLVVRNNLQRKSSQVKSTGIGLKNLGERISLISGKQLVIEETNEYFTVKMPLLK
ncbi:MAG: histidine kinase [Bacteroidales bacterium]